MSVRQSDTSAALLRSHRMPRSNAHRMLATSAMAAVVLLVSVPPADSKPVEQCAATKRVVNKGKPMPWATSMFSLLKKKKYIDTKLIPSIRRTACAPGPHDGELLDGTLDFHRGWKVRDPLDLEHGSWFRVVPGKTGVLLAVGGWVMFEAQRCVLQSDSITVGLATAGLPIDRKVTFYGLATDEVESIRATGGTGTRTGPDGAVLPREVTGTPVNNVYHFIAENGAAQLVVNRRNGAPPKTVNLLGPNLRPACAHAP